MRIPTSHRTLTRVARFSALVAAIALGGCQIRAVSIPSNEPLVTTSPKVGNIGQSQLPAIAAATGKREINVAAGTNSWVLRRLNAEKQPSPSPVQIVASPMMDETRQENVPSRPPASSTAKGLRDVSLAEIPLLDPTHYDPRRVR